MTRFGPTGQSCGGVRDVGGDVEESLLKQDQYLSCSSVSTFKMTQVDLGVLLFFYWRLGWDMHKCKHIEGFMVSFQ